MKTDEELQIILLSALERFIVAAEKITESVESIAKSLNEQIENNQKISSQSLEEEKV